MQAVIRWRVFRKGEVYGARTGRAKRIGYVIKLPMFGWWALTMRTSLGGFDSLDIAKREVEEAYYTRRAMEAAV